MKKDEQMSYDLIKKSIRKSIKYIELKIIHIEDAFISSIRIAVYGKK